MSVIGLDIGEKRVGIAISKGMIAVPLDTVAPDDLLARLEREQPELVVVGLPRNSCGEETQQSKIARAVAETLPYQYVFQDESLTSVVAEEQLRESGKPYGKADVDQAAAAIILQDYLERKQNA